VRQGTHFEKGSDVIANSAKPVSKGTLPHHTGSTELSKVVADGGCGAVPWRYLSQVGQLIAKLPRTQQITAIEIDPTSAAYLAMMTHCRAMSVSQTNFLDHVSKGAGYFGTFFNAILMTPSHQNEDVRHVMAAWTVSHRAAHW
jgi:hypothetical protein